MITALFQCRSLYDNIQIRGYSPSFVHGNMYCFCFPDTYIPELYAECMERAFNPLVSFIGLKPHSTVYDDTYHISNIGAIPRIHAVRTLQQSHDLERLMSAFIRIIPKFQFTQDQLNNICDCARIGTHVAESVYYCAAAINICQEQGRRCNYRAVLDPPTGTTYTDHDWNTMVRAMAHICYLEPLLRAGYM